MSIKINNYKISYIYIYNLPTDDMVVDEFPSIEEAESFVPPAWFYEDVTSDPKYQNSNLSR